jgi:hypothetical protein
MQGEIHWVPAMPLIILLVVAVLILQFGFLHAFAAILGAVGLFVLLIVGGLGLFLTLSFLAGYRAIHR